MKRLRFLAFTLVAATASLACAGSSDSGTEDPGGGLAGAAGAAGAGGGAPGGAGGASGKTSAGGAGGGGVTAEQVCADWAVSLCEKMSKCSKLLTYIYAGDLAQCEADQAEACVTNVTADGSNRTVAAQVKCNAAYKAASCSAFTDGGVTECESPPGSRAAGAGCIVGTQCASGTCEIAETATSGCGKCAKSAKVDEACGPGIASCEGDLYCGGLGCYEPTKAGSPCYKDALCAPGLGCGETGASCHTLGLPGDKCGPKIDDCSFYQGAVCNPGTSKCEPALYVTQEGQKCGFDTMNGHHTFCAGLLSCSDSDIKYGLCQKTAISLGQPCTVTKGKDPCERSSVCVGGGVLETVEGDLQLIES